MSDTKILAILEGASADICCGNEILFDDKFFGCRRDISDQGMLEGWLGLGFRVSGSPKP